MTSHDGREGQSNLTDEDDVQSFVSPLTFEQNLLEKLLQWWTDNTLWSIETKLLTTRLTEKLFTLWKAAGCYSKE